MPYIKPERRDRIDPTLSDREPPATVGELNFAITRLVDQFIADSGGPSYGAINDVVGVLECAKLEVYRRVAVPYEDDKIRTNGDVYTTVYTPVNNG